jgi:hypothetical protein
MSPRQCESDERQYRRIDLLYYSFSDPAIGPPGPKKEFMIAGKGPQPVRVRIVTLDLARLDEVPDQLGRGLTDDFE